MLLKNLIAVLALANVAACAADDKPVEAESKKVIRITVDSSQAGEEGAAKALEQIMAQLRARPGRPTEEDQVRLAREFFERAKDGDVVFKPTGLSVPKESDFGRLFRTYFFNKQGDDVGFSIRFGSGRVGEITIYQTRMGSPSSKEFFEQAKSAINSRFTDAALIADQQFKTPPLGEIYSAAYRTEKQGGMTVTGVIVVQRSADWQTKIRYSFSVDAAGEDAAAFRKYQNDFARGPGGTNLPAYLVPLRDVILSVDWPEID